MSRAPFCWAETMPEEIQLWLWLALEPHLKALGFHRLVERARLRRAKARACRRAAAST
jgi:hypothetical protein